MNSTIRHPPLASSVRASPYATPPLPPSPVVLLLASTDILPPQLRPLLAFQDLTPFKLVPTHYHPYRRQPRANQPEAPTPPRHQSVPPPLESCPNLPPSTSNVVNTPSSSHQSSPAPSSPSPCPSPTPESEIPCQARASTPAPKNACRRVKFPRPKGAGRKKIADLVNWEDAILAKVKVDARDLLNKHLDASLCYSSQDSAKLDLVRNLMVKEFPMLDNYVDCWPLEIILQSLLKYRSSSHGKTIHTKKT